MPLLYLVCAECEGKILEKQHTHGYGANKKDLLARLKRIEGQVRGIQKMIEDDRYCVDIMVQLTAIKNATHQVGLSLLDSHTHHCVKDAISNGSDGDEKIDELMDVIKKFTRG